MRMADIKPGWVVLGNDGGRVGTVRETGQHYLLVAGAGMSGDLHVPASAIANVEDEVVYLNLAKRETEAMGWGQPLRIDDEPETTSEPDLHRHV